MKLYGSTTSPFVRRIRLLLEGNDYELVKVNIFGEEREDIKAKNPTLKIPMFEDLSNPECPVLIDSGVIFNYLTNKLGLEDLSLMQQNLLAIINACNDSLVNMMILSRSRVDTTADKLYFNIQRERNEATFSYLDEEVRKGTFDKWNYLSMSLLVLVEWAQFRNLYDFNGHSNLVEFVKENQKQQGVISTKPVE
jgi:glutathione S-transferase